MQRKPSTLIGFRHGKLQVIDRDILHSKRFVVKCDCGNVLVMFRGSINSSRSCGCANNKPPANPYEWSETLNAWIPIK